MWGVIATPMAKMTSYSSSAAAAALAVQQGKIGVAAVARVVVDAQVHMACILGHAVVLAKQLDAGHIHSHHGLGSNSPLNSRGLVKAYREGMASEQSTAAFFPAL